MFHSEHFLYQEKCINNYGATRCIDCVEKTRQITCQALLLTSYIFLRARFTLQMVVTHLIGNYRLQLARQAYVITVLYSSYN